MKKIVISAFAFAAMTSVAMAEPAKMTDAQMDAVTAGQLLSIDRNVLQAAIITQANVNIGCVALCVGDQNVRQSNTATVTQTAVTGDRNRLGDRDRRRGRR